MNPVGLVSKTSTSGPSDDTAQSSISMSISVCSADFSDAENIGSASMSFCHSVLLKLIPSHCGTNWRICCCQASG